MDTWIKEGWLQGGFAGLYVVLSNAVFFVCWIVIKTLWKDNKELNQRIFTMAEMGRAVAEKQAEAALVEANTKQEILSQSRSATGRRG
jgi:hypothetical protein